MLVLVAGCNGDSENTTKNPVFIAPTANVNPACEASIPDMTGKCSQTQLTASGAEQSVLQLGNGSRIVQNLTYASRGGLTLQGDLYLPAEVDANSGALITIHGGGWQDCGRRRKVAAPAALVMSSVVNVPVFNIDYRLRQEGGGYPQNLSDVVCASQFLSDQAVTYGFQSGRLALMGESAGAHLALMTSLIGDREDIDPGCGSMPEIVATVAVSPPTDFPAIVTEASPVAQAVTSYTGSQCPRIVDGCSTAPDCDLCIDASPLAHTCAAHADYLLVHATDGYDPFIDDRHINDFYNAMQKSDATVKLVAAGEEGLTEAGCPVGTPVHGFTDCLTSVAGDEIVELLIRTLK